jgi:pyruvate,orthophosphate dikinase
VATVKKANKNVYSFGNGKADGNGSMKDLLGGKGANLAEMVIIGLPVPPGFTITTEVCTYFYENRKTYPKSLENEVKSAIRAIEKELGAKFGDKKNPLLVSVRSGSRASMPGMMDTILNLGLNDDTVQGLISKTKNERFAYDSYRRFVAMYGDVVLGLKPEGKDDIDPFEEILEKKKFSKGVTFDTELTARDLKELVQEYKKVIRKQTGREFPDDPYDQLWGAVGAVFSSWMNDRAIIYRKLNDIPESWGTAVNIQSMVFGNMGETSGTGVAFTRDAATGENYFYGEYLMNAQGEDVVAGTRTPEPIQKLEEVDPKALKQLLEIRKKLEKHYRDMMDIEFTIQEGKLFMLQCRVGKRTALASIKIAVDMVEEKLIQPKEALLRIEPEQLNQLLRPIFDKKEKDKALKDGKLLAKGLNAGPGAASGKVVFNAEDAETYASNGDPVILVRIETSPEDIKGMSVSEGILTARGGMTSHAALVARQMGKVCVAGCSALQIDYKSRTMKVEGIDKVVNEGDYISLDGSTGEVLLGRIQTKPSEVVQVLINKTLKSAQSPTYQLYDKIMKWADEFRQIGIRTNADQEDQAENAIAFGAEGIGLCRTEHMFFGDGKIEPMREMILSNSIEERKKALNKLLPLQRIDFKGLFHAMKGKPVTIRLIDPPLHEFLPHDSDEPGQRQLAKELGISVKQIKERIAYLHELNPMLGFRGCRLGIIYPEITEMQCRAIFEAAVETKRSKINVNPEIMIPLVGNYKELKNQVELVHQVAQKIIKDTGVNIEYSVGTMIEVPRGAITAVQIAPFADFFSFGTNDLTQTTLGLSRDDAGKFLPHYVEQDIYQKDPFEAIDREGVGFLMQLAVEGGRSVKPDLKLGICGEHGGESSSVEYCHDIGLNYVSCSPFRVPIARLAAGRAAIKNPKTIAKATTTKPKQATPAKAPTPKATTSPKAVAKKK